MNSPVAAPEACPDIEAFVRNRYYYGKLLDVSHFESEQSYFNHKRWLINRLVGGYGVVCGLRVRLTEDCKEIWVEPGVAIDRCGREIVVPAPSKKLTLPVSETEPAPALADQERKREGDHDDDDDDDRR